MAGPNFDIISGLEYTDRRDYNLVDPTILNPTSLNPLVDGEWLELDAAQKLKRGTSLLAANEAANALTFPVWAETGRWDTQTIQKVPVIRWAYFEARTALVDNTNCVVGTPLIVKDIVFKGVAGRRGLAIAPTTTANHFIFGLWEKTWAFPGGLTGCQFVRVPVFSLVK